MQEFRSHWLILFLATNIVTCMALHSTAGIYPLEEYDDGGCVGSDCNPSNHMWIVWSILFSILSMSAFLFLCYCMYRREFRRSRADTIVYRPSQDDQMRGGVLVEHIPPNVGFYEANVIIRPQNVVLSVDNLPPLPDYATAVKLPQYD